jgi:S1-C subfamily serine protease
MSSHPPIPRGRTLILLLVVALCAGLGAGGTPLYPFGGSQPSAAAAVRPDSDAVIYSRLEPSVVDVTATLPRDGETASGTGFVVDARAGLVLTNNHVIRDAASVIARLTSTGQTYRARIVGADAAADIAVLQLQGATGLTAAPVGGSAAVAVGTPVLAIGNRAGQDGSPAAAPGFINGLNQTIRAYDGLSQSTETLHGMLETSARIEPGDSGGPLAGPAGTVIGMDTAAGAGTKPAGYAIPIGAAMAIERRIAAGRHAHLLMASSEPYGISSGYP